jgi:hypothetical protein
METGDTGNTAIAIFVKTPGLSPVKTRLAADLGKAAAEEFYALCAAAVKAVARGTAFAPYWAVAEREELAGASWSTFPLIAQGEGGLGERIDRVYSTLVGRHGACLLIGADSPQLTAGELKHAARLARATFVMGPAGDGGFYLFGGSRPVPSKVWTSIPYSSPSTGAALAGAVPVELLAPRTDADTLADLVGLASELRELEREGVILDAQREVLRWIERFARV